MNLSRRTVIRSAVSVPLAGSLALTSSRVSAQNQTVRVGSKDFTEQFILGHMYIKVLEDLGIETSDNLNLGGTQIAHQALTSDNIDLYPEYTGTGLTEVLGIAVEDVLGGSEATPISDEATPISTDADATPIPVIDDDSQLVFDLVRERYLEEFGLVWLERSPANNTQALAVTREFSEENSLTTISDLSEIAGDLVISAPADFPERNDGLLGLQSVYGAGFLDVEVLPVAPGVKYQALLDDQAQIVLAFGTDGQIAGYDLVLLEDDLSLWPPYNVAPVVRQEVLAVYPEIEERFNSVTTSLTNEILAELNWRVEGDDREEPDDVAEDYLISGGFIGE